MPQTLKKQALTLTIANGFTRGLGFFFRLMTARLMGAEAIGVMELSASAAMLALTPATAGLPTAMSRVTARPNADQSAVLCAGLSLNRRIALVMMPLLFLLAPGMAWLLSDFRTLPAILISIPAVFLLGCCAVYSGWFYGRGDMLTPAQCECSEQIVRFVGSLVLLLIFTRSPLSVRAALPGFAGILAGICVWMMFRRRAPLPPGVPSADLRRELLALSAPTAVSRLCQTCLRMLTAVLLPLCLRQSGLTASAAPAVSRQESNRVRLKRTMRQLLLMAGLIGCLSSCVLFLFAQPISMLLYGEPALTGVLMALSPLSMLFAIQQVQFGLVTGLGVQRRAMPGTIVSSALTLVVMSIFCPMPSVRIFGAVLAMLVGSLVRVIWNAAVLQSAKRAA